MEMNIEKKFKVVDSVFFNGEIDYLLFRLTELNDTVDFFIILETQSENKLSSFEENIEKFKEWKDKIIYIKSGIPSDEKIDKLLQLYKSKTKGESEIIPIKLNQINDLSDCLDSLNLSFEDIILISEIDEIPVLPEIKVLQSYLSFEPVVFSQKNFLWNKNFVKQENHLGSLCFQYSHFITKSHISHVFTKSELKRLTLTFTPITFGYRFELFQNLKDSVNNISLKYSHNDLDEVFSIVSESRNNLVYYDFQTLSTPKILVKYDGDLPNHIDMLQSQNIGRTTPKKHLVVAGIDSYQNVDSDDYESISIVTHTTSITSESYKEVYDNIKIHYIQIPNQKYYDVLIEDNTLQNFQKMYFINEIKKILFLQHPLDIDIFEFYVAGKLKSYTWSQIKDNFIYDLLYN